MDRDFNLLTTSKIETNQEYTLEFLSLKPLKNQRLSGEIDKQYFSLKETSKINSLLDNLKKMLINPQKRNK